jgi:hypothetical protein
MSRMPADSNWNTPLVNPFRENLVAGDVVERKFFESEFNARDAVR